MKKLIVLEGLDGSGKATQAEFLQERLNNLGQKTCKISFPDYTEKSSELIKMYLNGQFGQDVNAVNPYVASTFYTVDRYASYNLKWKVDYLQEAFIIADRYTTSNIVYQMAKLKDSEWDSFLEWIYDFEYNKFKLPKPDLVLYLDVDPEISAKLLTKRYGGECSRDLHEKNAAYLKLCRKSAMYAAEKLGWKILKCFEADKIKLIEDISEDILRNVLKWAEEAGEGI